MSKELPKTYTPEAYEDAIYKKWEESGFFNPDVCVAKKVCNQNAEPFTIVLPPPNITDKLHLGHMVMVAVSDILIRYNRMRGKRALWIPGTDHAAIATQNVVEKKLWKEKHQTRHDLGREKFLAEVWQFVKTTQATIIHQLKKTGASLDWSREAFTLDETRQAAVKQMFIDMYNEGVIYQGYRVVNWCPRCQSTLADDEVEYKKEKGKLYWLKYGPFILATSRPETKLGDTAVAVYPGDERYKDMVGKKYQIPGVLGEFEITVVADRAVDPKFGSGAIKVTPAHDFTDYEISQRHGITMKQIINEEGKMMANCGKYAGLTTAEARAAIVKDMEDIGLIDHIEEGYEHNLAVCYRCGTTIEPLPSKQWFVAVDKKIKKLGGKSLKEKAIAVAKSGEIKFVPERFTKRYLDWMENLHDWCISRQIWFGHQIPAWYRKNAECRMQNAECKDKGVEITYYVHGTTLDNEQEKASGHYDVELSELGIRQSHDLKDLVKEEKFDAVFCSDLKRAVASATIAFGDKYKIIQDKRLRECDYGDLTRGDNKKVEAMEKKIINQPFPNGESYRDVENRVREFLAEVTDKYAGKKIAIVAHKAPQLAIEILLNNKTWEQAIDEDWRKQKAWQPGWKYELKELVYVGEEKPGENWTQDSDVLDTWFSSGMWTFSTLGYPKKTNDLKTYHPTQVLETGYEIITLWVSRMIMMSLFAMNEIPFANVYLHGMVLDAQGKKMSKSKGNGIDPLEMIQKYGTDAVRMSLIVGNTPGNDTRMSEQKIADFRNFANKLWNIARYIIMQNAECRMQNDKKINEKDLTLTDRWILGKMEELIVYVSTDIENFRFSQAGERLRDFTWNDLADWYLEAAKFEHNEAKSLILKNILADLLKLWHPFMPFVTEAIWSEMGSDNLLMVAPWPKENDLAIQEKENENFIIIINIIKVIRNLRSEYKIPPTQKVKAVIYAGAQLELLQSQAELIKNLRTGIGELEIKPAGEKLPQAAFAAVDKIEIYIPLADLVDLEKEKARMEKRAQELNQLIKSLESKLDNEEFVKRAPKEIVEAEIAKLENYRAEHKKLKEQMKHLK
ncbi:MAG: class I tRNA ligase family protein [Patescibacteria group bacterium]